MKIEIKTIVEIVHWNGKFQEIKDIGNVFGDIKYLAGGGELHYIDNNGELKHILRGLYIARKGNIIISDMVAENVILELNK